jgi:hypothetical protein
MTLTFQFRLPRFHPAWLLPPLVPLGQWFLDGPDITAPLMFRLVLTLAISAFALFLAREHRGARENRWSKELRLLMPPAVGTLVIPAAMHNDLSDLAVMLHCVGCLWMGATVFGSEFEHRTLGPLLTQPISRKRIFWEKLGILSVLSLVVYGNTMASLERVQGSVDWVILAVAPALAVSTGPLFSLLGRSTLAGMVFTATAPMLFLLLSAIVSGSIQSGMPVLSDPPTAEQLKAIEPYNQALFLWGDFQPWLRGLYLAAGPMLGWLWFRSLSWQDGAAVARPPSGSARSRAVLTRLIRILVPGASATAHLIRKEIRLHAIPWMIAALTTGLWVLWMIARRLVPEGDLKDGLNEFSPVTVIGGMLGVVALVTAGAGSVAEERALGTLDWQVTQPVTGRRQWWIKSLVAVVTGLVTGLLIPATLLAVGFGPERWEKEGLAIELLPTASFATAVGLALALSLYASSIARNTMRAVGLTVLLGAATLGLVWAAAMPGVYLMESGYQELHRSFADGVSFLNKLPPEASSEPNRSKAQLLQWATATAFAACALVGIQWAWLASSNFARSTMLSAHFRRQWIQQAAILVLLTAVGVGAFGQLFLSQQKRELAWYERSSLVRLEETLSKLAVNGSLPTPVAAWLQVRPSSPEEAYRTMVERDGTRAACSLGYALREQVRWIESRLKSHLSSPKGTLPEEIRVTLGIAATSPEDAGFELVRRLGPKEARELVARLPDSGVRPDPSTTKPSMAAPRPGNTLSPELRRRYNLPDPPRP